MNLLNENITILILMSILIQQHEQITKRNNQTRNLQVCM